MFVFYGTRRVQGDDSVSTWCFSSERRKNNWFSKPENAIFAFINAKYWRMLQRTLLTFMNVSMLNMNFRMLSPTIHLGRAAVNCIIKSKASFDRLLNVSKLAKKQFVDKLWYWMENSNKKMCHRFQLFYDFDDWTYRIDDVTSEPTIEECLRSNQT